MRGTGKVRAVGLACVVALTAVGCGVAADRVSSGSSGAPRPDAVSRQVGGRAAAGVRARAVDLSKAADATRAVRTGRFEMVTEMHVSGSDAPVSMKVTGAYDLDRHLVETSMDVGDLAKGVGGTSGNGRLSLDGWTMKTVTDGSKSYVQMPIPGLTGKDQWIAVDSADGASSTAFDSALDARAMLARLQGVTGPLTDVGHEQVAGVDTLHQKGELDLSKALDDTKGLSAEERRQIERDLTDAVGPVPFDVWVDADGLVRRVRMEMSCACGGPDEKATSASMTITFLDLGQPVDIQVPPPDKVVQVPGGMGDMFGPAGGQDATS